MPNDIPNTLGYVAVPNSDPTNQGSRGWVVYRNQKINGEIESTYCMTVPEAESEQEALAAYFGNTRKSNNLRRMPFATPPTSSEGFRL